MDKIIDFELTTLIGLIEDLAYDMHPKYNEGKDLSEISSEIVKLCRKTNITLRLSEKGYGKFSWIRAIEAGVLCFNDYLIFEGLFSYDIPELWNDRSETLKGRDPEKFEKREKYIKELS